MGRTTHQRPQVYLSTEERVRLAEARQTVADLSEREPAPEALTELGYEQRMARARCLEAAVEVLKDSTGYDSQGVIIWAQNFYDFVWEGKRANVQG